MSRTIGPFHGVSTLRVEGAYEMCAGIDSQGRPVHILTLGTSSSKDPSRRALLTDAVAWAHANTGIDDAPVLQADLDAEQPYVVVLQDRNLRGAERILERLLSLGPPTGRLPKVQKPGDTTNTYVSSMPPPPSPSRPPKRPRSLVRPIILGLLAVVVLFSLTGGTWLIWQTFSPEEQSTASGEDDSDTAEETDDGRPEWTSDAPSESLGGGQFGDEDTSIMAERDWPVAFRVPTSYSCQGDGRVIDCTTPNDGTIEVTWNECRNCDRDTRRALRDDLDLQPMREGQNPQTAFQHRDVSSGWQAQASLFTHTIPGSDAEQSQAHVVVTIDIPEADRDSAQKVLNDVLNQVLAVPES
ncbi:hypothetical protein [Haloglycomyces albus]|uniref:hypothetical protein n=1 Tax=Haloglycomyces albus TaxID=526067 RepID=UPI00046D8765|nr:hypothetical protein [Haloglycomyces albus]